jgi:hydrogenase maturation factor
MSIIANDRPDLLSFMSDAELNEVRSWQNDLSVLREARLLRDLAAYMHDPTEGGIEGGVFEICASCELDADISAADMPISPLTAQAAEKIGFDPLHLISSGVLVAALPCANVDEAMGRLSAAGIKASVIGRFVERKNGGENKTDTHEELWRILDLPEPLV